MIGTIQIQFESESETTVTYRIRHTTIFSDRCKFIQVPKTGDAYEEMAAAILLAKPRPQGRF